MRILKTFMLGQWIGGGFLLLLAGCSLGESKFLGSGLKAVNHTSAAINQFFVNGSGGGKVSPFGYGGGMGG